MIKGQSVRLLSLILSNHHRRRHCGCCLMDAAPSLLLGNNERLILSFNNSKGFYVPSAAATKPSNTPDNFQFLSLRKNPCSLSSVYTIIAEGNAGLLRTNGKFCFINGLRFRLKGCCSDSRTSADNNISNCNNASHKVRASAPCLPPLLPDSGIWGLEDKRDPMLFNGHGGALRRGSSLGFPDQPLPDKIAVAVDVDEVLGNFVSALNRFIEDRYSFRHSLSEYHVYEFFKIWNCSRDEADIRVHEFFKTSYFKAGIHPIPGARQALQKLSRFCNLSVVTSRQNAIKDHTIEWIEKHYPGLFQGIHFGNHFALDGQARPKSDICRSLGAKILIDDNPRYAIECAEVGIRVLLFDYENSYPWCKAQSVDQHPLVTKVHNWEEVEHQLVSWVLS